MVAIANHAGGIVTGESPEEPRSFAPARGVLFLMVLAAPLCAYPAMFDLFDGAKRVLTHVGLMLALMAWSVGTFSGRRRGIRVGWWHAAFVIFLTSQLPGVYFAVNGVVAVEEWIHRLLWLVAFFLGSQLYTDPKRIPLLAAGTIGGGVIAALIGLLQSGGLDFPDLYPQVAIPASSFGNKNMAAEYIALVIPVTTVFALGADRSRIAMPCAAFSGFLFAYIFYSTCRGSWVALFLGFTMMGMALIVFGLTREPGLTPPGKATFRRTGILAGIALTGLVTGYAVVQISKGIVAVSTTVATRDTADLASISTVVRIGSDLSTYSVTWRFRIWANSLALAKDHLLFGVGPGNWKFWYPKYFDEVATDTDFNSRVQADTPHNDYLQYLGEAGLTGILGLIVLAVGMGLLLRAMWIESENGGEPLTILLVVIGMMTIYSTNSIFSFPVQKAAPTYLLFLWLGVIAARAKSYEVQAGRDTGIATLYLIFLAGLQLFTREKVYFDSECGFKKGYLLVNEGKVYDAWGALSRAHALRPDNHALSVFAGGIAMELGMIDEGLRLNQKAIESHPYFTNAYNQLGNAHWRKREFDEAEAAYRRSLDIHPTLTEPLRNLASLMLARSRLTEAIPLLETLIKSSIGGVAPEDKLDLAEAYRLTGKLDQSRELYTELQTSLPQEIRVPFALGEIARASGKLDEAVKQFRHALTLAPGDSRAKLGLARTLSAMGREKESQSLLQEMVTHEPESETAQVEIAESIRRNGDVKGAAEMYQELLRKNPKSALFHSKLANLLLSMNDRQGASDHFQLAVTADPRRMLDWARLGRIHVEAGNLDEAKIIFERALAVEPNERKILNEMGLVLNRLGKSEEAIAYFQRASVQPDVEPEVFFNLGSALAKAGRREEAVKALKTFIALWRGDPKFRDQAAGEIARLESR